MPSLRDLQKKLLADILERNQHAAYLNHSDRINAYGDGYYRRFRGVLQNYFTIVRWYMGDGPFAEALARYIPSYPPSHPNINFYGDDFSTFLQDHHFDPVLIDIAKTQTILHHAHLQAPQKAFDLATVANQPLESWFHAKLTFQPSMTLFTTSYPIHILYNAYAQKDPPPASVPQKTMHYVTHRQGSSIFFEAFERIEYDLLIDFLAKHSLGQVLSTYEDQNIAEKLFEYFHKWQTYQLITGISFP